MRELQLGAKQTECGTRCPNVCASRVCVHCHCICCRVFGCFRTSQEWLTVSLRDDKPPQGMQIKGVAQERVTVWLSPGLRTAPGRPDIVDSFRLLEAKRRQWKIEPDLGALRGAYDAYVESRGLRSQPWKRLCALDMNTDENHEYTQENVSEVAAICSKL